MNITKSIFAALSIFILFSIVSCSPAKNDSTQTPEVPALPQNQMQNSSVETEEPFLENIETTSQVSPEENNGDLTINPPHGEPGHRCDIPVGAPLNSQTANTSPQITSNPSPTTNTVTNPANNGMAPTIENARRLNSSQSRNTGTMQNSGRINPPHGQPGHRCDIPVGSPLP